MSKNKPFFSVVIPTRNRAKILPFAIQSVLNQTFEDFELVVSDNSSSDNTKAVVMGFDDKRLRYFQTNEALSVGDSWEFALSQATGKYITFLSDDDAYLFQRLQRCQEEITKSNSRLLVHKFCMHYTNTANQSDENVNLLEMPYFSNDSILVDSDRTLKELYSGLGYDVPKLPSPFFYGDTPHMSNAIYESSIFSELHKKTPKLMREHASDIFLGVLSMYQSKQYVFLDCPLTIVANHPDSLTVKIKKSSDAKLLETLNEKTSFGNSPLKVWTSTNGYADILLEASNVINSIAYPINWRTVYIRCYLELLERARLIENSDELKHFYQALGKESSEIQDEVKQFIDSNNQTSNKLIGKIKNRLREIVRIPTITNKFNYSRKFHRRIYVSGHEETFHNILELAAKLDESLVHDFGKFWIGKSKSPLRNYQLR